MVGIVTTRPEDRDMNVRPIRATAQSPASDTSKASTTISIGVMIFPTRSWSPAGPTYSPA